MIFNRISSNKLVVWHPGTASPLLEDDVADDAFVDVEYVPLLHLLVVFVVILKVFIIGFSIFIHQPGRPCRRVKVWGERETMR